MSTDTHVKSRAGTPAGFFECEAAGLRWLAEAQGARVVDVVGAQSDRLVLSRIASAEPTRAAAEAFGAALAQTHDAGAAGFGAAPDGWDGPGFFGPLSDPRPMPLIPRESFGEFWAEDRIASALDLLPGVYSTDELVVFDRLKDRLHSGEFDDSDPAARLHGDLWWGNLMWDADGAVLIDPAAHGGHREEDLALLGMFGASHFEFLDVIISSYEEAHPLPPGREERADLHRLFAVLMHAVFFGGGYAGQALRIAHRYA